MRPLKYKNVEVTPSGVLVFESPKAQRGFTGGRLQRSERPAQHNMARWNEETDSLEPVWEEQLERSMGEFEEKLKRETGIEAAFVTEGSISAGEDED